MDARASLPAIGRLLANARVRVLVERHGKARVTDALRDAVALARDRKISADEVTVIDAAARALDLRDRGTLVPVINATGVLLHTNLGRAPLPSESLEAIARCGAGYSTLEFDLATGERGSRHVHAAERLRAITGAQDALVANNAAAALLLAVSTLATQAPVIVSRGELIEIGGAFRIPDVVASGGARLVEVGTTNRTRLADYERALEANEGAVLLKVHRSNFEIVGFTEETSLAELVALARARTPRPPVVYDLGSGLLLPGRDVGLPDEPDVPRAIADGADVVVFSGDKLLGGPQAGLAVGTSKAIAAMRKHPLMRAIRAGKLVLSALDAILRTYERGGDAVRALPVVRMLTEPSASVRARAQTMAKALGGDVVESVARVGAGAQPTATIASWAVKLPDDEPDALAKAMREGEPVVVGRIEGQRLLLDARTVGAADVDAVVSAVTNARARG